MLLGAFYEGVEIHRGEKIVYARFLVPHRVISTCHVAGGLRDDLAGIYNHQSCEPSGHHHATHGLAIRDPRAYRSLICSRHGLPDGQWATLGTAANMRYAAMRHASFRDLEVVAVCTGGVETNAGRAGDPASVYEKDGIFERVGAREPVTHGTINTLLFISSELTPGAMARSIMMATEAKTAALQELAVNSRYSDGLATGTGTDQIGVASRLGKAPPLTSAGKHSKLGELIGQTVHDAVRATLALQNELTPEGQRSTVIHLERFGTTSSDLLERMMSHLNESDAALLRANFKCIERDPLVVAAVAALVHLRDKALWGVLPESCVPDIWAACGAQIAAAVSGNYTRIDVYRKTMANQFYPFTNEGMLRISAHAMALGFQEKWRDAAEEENSNGD